MPLLIADVPIECIHQAAIEYQVPAKLIISVLKTENGRVGLASKNGNNTYDYGPMQINSSWLPRLASYGYTQHDIQFDACKNVKVGAWILSQSISNESQLWRGIGDYHSHTEHLNQQYSSIVYVKYEKLEQALRTDGSSST
jgi:hypothetical protein